VTMPFLLHIFLGICGDSSVILRRFSRVKPEIYLALISLEMQK
jgi:hypothetical protein